jgi:SNF2 family DNA or RNA helicase
MVHDDEILEGEIVDIDPTTMLEQANAAYEELADIDAIEEESLAKLIEEERKIKEALDENKRKQREIANARFTRRAQLREAEKRKQEAETKVAEQIRYRQLEEAKAQRFREMVANAKEAGYAWVDYAKPHQWEGAMTIAHYGSAILADDTGLGKTITGIMALDLAEAKKVLVLVPNDIVTGQADEFKTWAPHRSIIPIEGANPAMRKMVKTIVDNSNEFVIVVNYESLWRDFSWLEDVRWDYIVVDEAHNMKNEEGLTFTALDQFRYNHFLPVTATTILNSPGDLFALLHMLDKVRFNDKRLFLQSYCTQTEQNKWVFRPGGEKALMKSLPGRFIKRSYLEANVKIPDMHIVEVEIPRKDVSEAQLTIMKQLNEFAAIALESGESMSVTAMIALITRERQAAVYPAGIEVKMTQKMYDDAVEYGWPGGGPIPEVGTVLFKVPDNTPSIKLDWAEERLEHMVRNRGRRCVVFSQFKTALADLEKRLIARGISVVRFDGDTNKNLRYEVKRDFLRPASGERKTDYKYDVVLANYKTGGVGLNFTDATYFLGLDKEWNPAKNHQARSRIHRIGQTEETLAEYLNIQGSIDGWMTTVNEIKEAIVNGFEAEIDTVESLRQYLTQSIEQDETKAIESTATSTDVTEDEDEDLSWLDL